MLRVLLPAAAACAALLVPAAAMAAQASYEITNSYSGQTISGNTKGKHSLPAGTASSGVTQVKGGKSPVVVAQGTVAPADSTFLRMYASYSYDLTLRGKTSAATSALHSIFSGSPGSAVIGQLTGIFRMEGSDNSDSSISLEALSEYGSHNLYAACDAGVYCYGPGSVTGGADVPYTLQLHANDFGFGCFSTCSILPNSQPFTRITMEAWAGVGNTSDGSGNPIGGHVYAMLDPSFSLDPTFFTANGLDPADFTVRASGGAVPEPASWALMIAGTGLIGGLLRSRPRLAVA